MALDKAKSDFRFDIKGENHKRKIRYIEPQQNK